ncbi:MAG: holo-ACP synthase [Candidatus Izemoplasmatales bacterium]|nr:holo-ACP synthase [Candidatus Izemoplasmatales bacterium]
MILGVGVDICQNNRVKTTLSERILSDEEKMLFDKIKLENQKIEFLAGRFAVKEAIIKSISPLDYEIGMRDLVVLNDEKGMPYLKQPTFFDKKIFISLSHEKEYSVGYAIVESL